MRALPLVRWKPLGADLTLHTDEPLRVERQGTMFRLRRIDDSELARRAPGLDRLPLDEVCGRAQACLQRRHDDEVSRTEAGRGWDFVPPDLPQTLGTCQAVIDQGHCPPVGP